MNKLIVMRGVSGSGKSTKAREILKQVAAGEIAYICSADDYFIDRSSGMYNFDPKKIGGAHSWCKAKAETAMDLGVNIVIIDNTNTKRWEYQPYIDLAEHFGYEVQIETVGQIDESNLKVYANRNKHGVSLDVIKKQAARFEV